MRKNELIGKRSDGTTFKMTIKDWLNLKEFSLQGNNLVEIDLTFLMYCYNLETFDISNNQLKKINLTPLQYCRKLRKLNLSSNKIEEIDLSQFTYYQNNNFSLKQLNLSNNLLEKIDLTSLKNCINLEFLDISNNKLNEVDLSPLQNCVNLAILRFDDNLKITISSFSEGLSKYVNEIILGWQEYMIEIEEFQKNEPPIEDRLLRFKMIQELEKSKGFEHTKLNLFLWHLYKETVDCYIYGCFMATIALTASLMERFLENEIEFEYIKNYQPFYNNKNNKVKPRAINLSKLVELANERKLISTNLKTKLEIFIIVRHGVIHYPEVTHIGMLGFKRVSLRGKGKSRNYSFESRNRKLMLSLPPQKWAEKGIALFLDMINEFNFLNKKKDSVL